MTSILLSTDSLAQLKRETHKKLPEVKSSHLSEALAAAFGFRTNAALLASLTAAPQSRTPDIQLFTERLQRFGYTLPQAFSFGDEDAPQYREDSSKGSFYWEAFAEVGLQKTYSERCYNYGVRIEKDAKGQIWAAHNVAGYLGPFDSEARAEREACVVWNI